MPNAAGSLWDRARRRGLAGSIRRLCERVMWRLEEMRMGVRTAGSIPAEQLGHGEQQFGYQPIDPQSLRAALDFLQPSENDVFVDMGCGMGRGVLVAGRYPFAKILGVEYSRELFVAAHRNAARASKRLGKPLQIIHADATSWEFPDEVTVVFLFNPFQGEKLERMLANLHRSLEKSPRKLHIVYSLPRTDRDQLAECSWLKKRESIETANSDWERLTVYRACLD